MYDLGSVPASEAIEFLESEEVQGALASLFQGTQTAKGKETIRKHGFWMFASGAIEEVKPPSAQAQLLNMLYSQLKGYLESNEGHGNVPCFDYDSKWEKAREHIHTKLKDEGLPAGRIIIEIVVPENKPCYRLCVMPSVQVAQAVRSREGRMPKKQVGVAPDAISRRVSQIKRSSQVVLSRLAIDTQFAKALVDKGNDVLILPGSFLSGKSTWLLEFHQRNACPTAHYPFCEDDVELQQESYFAESLAGQLAALAGVSGASKSARGVDSCAKLGEFITALGTKLDGLDVLVLLDGIDQSGDELLSRILTMLRQYLQGDTRPLRWILTVRSPSPALLALCSLPYSSVVSSFDDESCVLEFIQSYLAAVSNDCSGLEALANEVYGISGSNIILMRRVAHDMLEVVDVE